VTIANEALAEVGYFDRHSGFLCILVSGLLLLYTFGLLVTWYGLALGEYNAATYGAYFVIFPTELVILASFLPRSKGVAFQRIHLKTHSTWLILDQIYRFITGLDLMFAVVGGAASGIFLASPIVEPGFFTADKIALLWAGMALLALFSVLYGRSLMQVLGMKYETLGGHSLAGASAYASIASFKLGNRKGIGLDYLQSSLSHVKSVLASRGSELVSVETVKQAVRSLQDSVSPPFDTLQVLANNLAVLPNLEDLPNNLQEFLSQAKWPKEIKPITRRTYGIEWIAATATISAATVGLIATIIQTSGPGVVAQVVLSPVAAYAVGIAVTLPVVLFLYRTLSHFSVETRDVDEYERNLIQHSGASLGTRTTLVTMLLVPKAFVAAGTAALAVISGFFLLGSLIIAIWYRNFLAYFPSSLFIFAAVLFVGSFLITWVLIRNVRHELRPKKVLKT
jgi:hypothetical protein